MMDAPKFRRSYPAIVGLSVVALLLLGVLIWSQLRETNPPKGGDPDQPSELTRKDFPPPPFRANRFLNTGPTAEHIGTQACANCHKAQFATYSQTAHSKAFSDLTPDEEPPNGSYVHAPSGRTYTVYRKDGKLRHRETETNPDGGKAVQVDLAVKYLIGSGRFTRSYIVEENGFLHESPITWYASRNGWHMSPGYDKQFHGGFTRQVDVGCLHCHTGGVRERDESTHRIDFIEKSIGCESCHGPGSLHQEHHLAMKPVIGGEDLTIVTPSRLDREHLESVCAQCHLRGDATIQIRGRDTGEFRPGRLLSDYRIDYRLKSTNDEMTVVGHIGQLRMSKCYQGADSLTCVTCHDPHAGEAPKDPIAFYRGKCLECHDPPDCGLEMATRLERQPRDDCVACHMPRGDTDIPHIAFTHHRIGIHNDKPVEAANSLPELVALTDTSHLPRIERVRNLGLAYLEVSYKQPTQADAAACRRTALHHLGGVYERGLRDGQVLEGLARAYFDTDPVMAPRYAALALDAGDLPPKFRDNAMVILAMNRLDTGDHRGAVDMLKELTLLRRHAEDWRLLGISNAQLGQFSDARRAVETAVSIDPFRPDLHQLLSEICVRNEDMGCAREHAETARRLGGR